MRDTKDKGGGLQKEVQRPDESNMKKKSARALKKGTAKRKKKKQKNPKEGSNLRKEMRNALGTFRGVGLFWQEIQV